LRQDERFQVQVRVEFGGAGAICADSFRVAPLFSCPKGCTQQRCALRAPRFAVFMPKGLYAIALMPVALPIQVNFFADPYGCGAKIDLGNTIVATSAKIFTYTPTLTVPSPALVALMPEEIYQITAVLRVGVPNSPAFITGYIEGLAIQTYNP